jgi:thymidylate synthase (FAD)
MEVKLINSTTDGEKLISFCARVSNPGNQDNPDYEKLLKYCLKNAHWSVFEQAAMTVEITTSRAISAQILRHKSFNFQEFSQRYSAVTSFETYEARRQDNKNRQNSIDDLPEGTKEWFSAAQHQVQMYTQELYDYGISLGIAKEQMRFLLPMSSTTTLYMNGTIRSWLTYFMVRMEKGTQKEHRDIANAVYLLFRDNYPTIAMVFEDMNQKLFEE